MFDTRFWLILALVAVIGLFVRAWWRGSQKTSVPSLLELAVGCVTNFFDTLGIGSFAPTTSIFKFKAMVPDEKIPGTLNVGDTIPQALEAIIFIAIIGVDPLTLTLMIAASVLGAWVGAGIVGQLSRRRIQIGMAIALLAAALSFVMSNLNLFPSGGVAMGLSGMRILIAVGGIAILGALMTLGIGLYAPCMILVSMLGMSPRAAFPIMMGACAFLCPVASLRFIKLDSYSSRPALGLTMGGIVGVVIAAYVVKSLPLVALRWLVVAAVSYASFTMLRSAMRSTSQEGQLELIAEAAGEGQS